jgi:hypothetical protein
MKLGNYVVVRSWFLRHATRKQQVAQMLVDSIGRVVCTVEGEATDKIVAALWQNEQAIRHVADWFQSAVLEKASWLSNVNEHGHPKKLLKYGSLERIFAEADKVMLRKSRGLGRRGLNEGSEEVIATLEGGYSIVRMLTSAALDAESAEMQHCIGHGSYDEYLEAGSNTMLLSLRDRNGRAHATIEIEDRKIVQVQGKQNKSPAEKYIVLLVGYFAREKFDFGYFGAGDDGWIVDVHGVIHQCDRLPSRLHVAGDLRLSDVPMPTEIEAGGRIYITVASWEVPPRSLKAGDIHIYGSGFREMPEVVTGGTLRLAHTAITQLPSGLSVKNLRVEDTPLQRLPDDIKIEGDVVLRRTEVTSLPSGLWCRDGKGARANGTVDLTGSPISSLGGLTVVCGSLLLEKTAIKELPSGLFVTRDMDISDTAIRDVHEGVAIGGDLKITNANVRFHHKKMTVGGSVKISQSTVRLPKELTCGQTFLARDSILVMPESLESHEIEIDKVKLNRFPKRLKARHIWAEKVAPSGFLNKLSLRDCDLEANFLNVMDKPLKLGVGVKAETVVVYADDKSAVSMTSQQAREYLGNHKIHACHGGLMGFAESISAIVRGRNPRLFFAGRGPAPGQRLVYDEFHRSAA